VLRDYLDERFKVLSLSGPTKSGKTVLVRRVAPDAAGSRAVSLLLAALARPVPVSRERIDDLRH
jgi:hypothetical protein